MYSASHSSCNLRDNHFVTRTRPHGGSLAISTPRGQLQLDPLRDAGIVAALVFAAGVAVGLVPPGTDDEVYWLSGHVHPLYQLAYVWPGFFYSPAFAQVLAPLTVLPLSIFAALWKLLLAAAVFYLVRRWAALAFLIPFVTAEMMAGNVNLLIGAAIVLGFEYPGAWAFVLLTKVSPGVGLIWFAARREWRQLAVALATTGAAAAISLLLAPDLWRAWVSVLVSNAQTASSPDALNVGPIALRAAVAAAVAFWGARTDRRWAIPVAATIALPVIYIGGLSVLLASVPLYLRDRHRRVSAQESPAALSI